MIGLDNPITWRTVNHVVDRPLVVVNHLLWSTYACVYDGLLDLIEYRRLINLVTHAATLTPGQRVVEVGCGTGNVLAALVEREPAELVGVDSSAAMLNRASRKVGGPGVVLIKGDLLDVLHSLRPASVDRVIAVNVLYSLRDRRRFWHEIAHVLAPDGVLIATQCDRPGFSPLVREQVKACGWRGLIKPRLFVVAVFDKVIDLLAKREHFDFAGFEVISEEASREASLVAEDLGRCYGGPVDGVNLLIRFVRNLQDDS